MIRKVINYVLRKIMMTLSAVLPVNADRVYVSSFLGHYSDSPKQIALMLKKHNPKLEIVYLVTGNNMDLPDNFTRTEVGSWKNVFYRATAKVIIDNNYGGNAVWLKGEDKKSQRVFFASIKKKKKQQHVFSTWHGTPLKKMGIDSANSNIKDFDCPYTTMCLGNMWTADVMRRLTFNKIPIIVTGTPRNDVLLVSDVDREKEIRRKIGIDQEKKILLYAPTFREAGGEGSLPDVENSGLKQIENIDFNELVGVLSKKFGGEWMVILRFHHYVANRIDWKELSKQYNNTVINGNLLDDMVDYLQITDVLVTDASSCFFDFALTRKPCFLFFPDVDTYRQERGLYMDFDELPFPMSKNYDKFIESIEDFDNQQYKMNCNAFLNRIGNADDGKATERICNLIEKSLQDRVGVEQ